MPQSSGVVQSESNQTYEAPSRTLNVRVPRASLRNAVGNGLLKRGRIGTKLRLQTRVLVEADPDDRADSVFYAPFAEVEHESHADVPNSSGSTPSVTPPSTSSESTTKLRRPPTQTQRVPVSLTSKNAAKHLAYAEDNFELSFVGMNIPPQDCLPSNGNELLLYSLRSHVFPDGESDNGNDGHDESSDEDSDCDQIGKRASFAQLRVCDVLGGTQKAALLASRVNESHDLSPAEECAPPDNDKKCPQCSCGGRPPEDDSHVSNGRNKRVQKRKQKSRVGSETVPPSVADANGINLLPTDVPLIHYDPFIDGHGTGTQPDSFLPVPASKAIFRQHRARSQAMLLPVRFTVMEIDRITSTQTRAVAKIDSVNGFASHLGVAVPYADIISMAVSVVNRVGLHALQKYAQPDHVISKDMEFRIASCTIADAVRSNAHNQSHIPNEHLYPAAYLRYGYYFFLKHKVDAKLYAQTDASSQNVPLLLRRAKFTPQMAARGEKEYFPLTGVSYVVMKVSPGFTRQPRDRTRAFAMENRARLEHILHINNALDMLSDIK